MAEGAAVCDVIEKDRRREIPTKNERYTLRIAMEVGRLAVMEEQKWGCTEAFSGRFQVMEGVERHHGASQSTDHQSERQARARQR